MPHLKTNRVRKNRRQHTTVHRLGPEDYAKLQELQDKEFREAAERQISRNQQTSEVEKRDDRELVHEAEDMCEAVRRQTQSKS